jgi:hypothetical protein
MHRGRQCHVARRWFIELSMRGWDQHKDLKNNVASKAQAIEKPIAVLQGELKQPGRSRLAGPNARFAIRTHLRP